MSVTELPEAKTTQSRSQKLRFELKEWERSFTAANAGRKAEREDIKRDPAIAQKYKEYNKLRTGLSRDLLPSSSPPTKKRKLDRPDRSQSQAHEPIHSQPQPSIAHPSSVDPYDPPLNATPRAIRTFVGPTPQKNGLVLGLFDLLSPPSAKPTPCKPTSRLDPSTISRKLDLHATPSKNRNSTQLTATPVKHSRSPQSSSRRAYLDTFLTPTTRRFNAQLTPASRGSRNVAHQYFLKTKETPEFLRHSNHFSVPVQSQRPTLSDDGEVEEMDALLASPITVRLPPKPPIGRSLSALVKGLRKIEDDQADEDLEMLREMEAEQELGGDLAMPRAQRTLVLDGQITASNSATQSELPLGANGENGESSGEDEEESKGMTGKDGKPLKIWKKRGQKRTTRKVNIRPNTAKWKPEPEWEARRDEADEADKDASTVSERQVLRERGGATHRSDDDDKDDRDEDADDASFRDEGSDGNGCETKKKKIPPAAAKKGKTAPNDKDDARKKPKRKVAATAHANFRALKIRSKGSKGKKGRFGRRR